MRRHLFVLVTACLTGCSGEVEPTTATLIEAQDVILQPRYDLIEIDETLGGSVAVGTSINNRGDIAGYSTRSDGTRHAVFHRDSLVDLGTLGGPNSAVVWPGLNGTGTIVGISQTGIIDERNEAWSCEAFMPASPYTCVGFVYEDGVMTPLPTLGGPNGFATMANERGQVVGWAENTVEDPTCKAPQVYQFRAVLWEPRTGEKRELPPAGDDETSAATAINDRGEVVGISGRCYVAVGDSSARAAVIWRDDVPQEIPLPTSARTWHTPMDINQGGQVVGFYNRGDVGGGPTLYAFLWTGSGVAQDLGALEGHSLSQAYGINARGQIVGRSCGAVGCRAILYENGRMLNLNDLVPAGSDLLTLARYISDGGVIVAQGTDAATGQTRIYVAVPKGSRPQ